MIRCIAVDDEPLALDLLESFIARVPYLTLVKKCSNAFDAMHVLKHEKIDLIFLDVNMPDISGLQLIKSLEKKPAVIFTTAYSEHAIEGFNLDAIDYLLKPFSFDRFLRAVNKAYQQLDLAKAASSREETKQENEDYMFIKSGYNTIRLKIKDINYIEGLKDYIQIFTPEGKILSLISMKSMLEKLPPGEFARIHRSYIVPLSKISVIQTRKVRIDNKELPIGDMYRENFLKLVEQKKVQK